MRGAQSEPAEYVKTTYVADITGGRSYCSAVFSRRLATSTRNTNNLLSQALGACTHHKLSEYLFSFHVNCGFEIYDPPKFRSDWRN